MSATAILAEAERLGVTLSLIAPDRIAWTCAADPPPDLLERIRANKPAVVQALRAAAWFGPDSALELDPTRRPAGADDNEAERWTYLFHERAAIREFDGGADRAVAEREALQDLAAQWRCEHPLRPSQHTDPCVHCGLPMTMEQATPVLSRPGQHAWLHRACWGPMDASRSASALEAVRVLLGLAP